MTKQRFVCSVHFAGHTCDATFSRSVGLHSPAVAHLQDVSKSGLFVLTEKESGEWTCEPDLPDCTLIMGGRDIGTIQGQHADAFLAAVLDEMVPD